MSVVEGKRLGERGRKAFVWLPQRRPTCRVPAMACSTVQQGREGVKARAITSSALPAHVLPSCFISHTTAAETFEYLSPPTSKHCLPTQLAHRIFILLAPTQGPRGRQAQLPQCSLP